MKEERENVKTENVDFKTALKILTGMSEEELKSAGLQDVKNSVKFRRNFTVFTDPSKDGRIVSMVLIETAM